MVTRSALLVLGICRVFAVEILEFYESALQPEPGFAGFTGYPSWPGSRQRARPPFTPTGNTKNENVFD
jgi:hypothetical protein